MIELGYSRINVNNIDSDSNSYNGIFIHGDQTMHSYGIRLLIDKIYLGFELVQGLELHMSTAIGNNFSNGLTKFDGNAERGLFKVGYLSPISKNIYLDTAYHYLFILEEELREQSIELAEVGYLTLGISFFWDSNK